MAEQLAIDRAKELFGAEHANVQPHAGRPGQRCRLHVAARSGDRILGMKLDHGGHLTHGMKINFSGLYFDIVAYGVRQEDSLLDMDELARAGGGDPAQADHRRLVPAYPRQLDFARFREIADSVAPT